MVHFTDMILLGLSFEHASQKREALNHKAKGAVCYTDFLSDVVAALPPGRFSLFSFSGFGVQGGVILV